MKLSIIIPSKERELVLSTTLRKAYESIKDIEAEIIVVNDSKTTNITIDPDISHKVNVLQNSKDGVASARNLGASHAKGDLLLFLDDDMWIREDNLYTTIKLHQSMKHCCINFNWEYPPDLNHEIKRTQFGRYLHYYGFTTLKGWCKGQFWDDQKIFPTDGITSQYLSIAKNDFWRTRGYNEKFPHAGFEDHALYKALMDNKIQPYVYPLSMVYHNEADRMHVKAWLARKQRGGETRRVAVEMGYHEVAIKYNMLKKTAYRLLKIFKPALYNTLAVIPNLQLFDPLYFRIVNLLLGTVSYEGYTNKRI